MEIKEALYLPYTEVDKLKFISKCNGLNYKIEYVEKGLEAWGMTDEEIAEQEKQKRINEIYAELDKLDLKSIRAIRANDEEYIRKYEADAELLRKELKELQKGA